MLGMFILFTILLLTALLILKNKTTIERLISQTESRLKKKGSILEPESEELSNWVEGLPTE